MQKSIVIHISGRVQGVMYRQAIKNYADKNNLVGTAENLKDGRVKVVANGSEDSLRSLVLFCETGSTLTRVKSISYEWATTRENYSDFQIVRSGGNILDDQINAISNLGKSFFATDKKELVYPKHLVIIPDGNRRWAKEKGLPSIMGHDKGRERIGEILELLKDSQVQVLTVWAFSTENWKREESEVKYLMDMLGEILKEHRKTCLDNKIVFRHLGRKTKLDPKLLSAMDDLERETAKFLNEEKIKRLNIAVDYGGRDEIVRAVNKIESGTITEEEFEKYLDTAGIPDPDLIIRTSGEMRLSGILPWQSTYAELYFTQKHFPDFDKVELDLAMQDFSNRKRRFGA
jgi:undecaprenyl diphosphate synthase